MTRRSKAKFEAPLNLEDLVPLFLKWLYSRGRKRHPGREAAILKLARRWDKYNHEISNNRRINQMDREWMEDYFLDQYSASQPVTKRAYQSQLKGFLDWVAERYDFDPDCATFDPGYTSGRSQRPKLWLTPNQMRSVWEEAKHPYWRAVVAFLALTCCRSNELRDVQMSQILNLEEVVINRIKTHDTGDRIPITPRLREELQRYIFWYQGEIGRELRPSDYLFPAMMSCGPHGEITVRDSLQQRGPLSVRVRELILPHVPDNTPPEELTAIGCHTLRRSGALAYYRKWIKDGRANAMELVQALLGHDKVSTTQIYLNLNFQRAERNNAMAGMDLFEDEQEGEVIPIRSAQHS